MDTSDYNEIIKTLREKFVGQSIEVPYYFQLDNHKYMDRKCHKCGYDFKIYGDDWDHLNDMQHCPLCNHCDDKNNWTTPEQEIKKQEQFERGVKEKLGDEITVELENFYQTKGIQNPYQIEGFPFPDDYVPETVKDLSRIEIQCHNCNIRYAIFGSAYFCPNCGTHSFRQIFHNNMTKIDVKLKRALLAENEGDEGLIISRSLIETALNDCVVAFQFYNNALFEERFAGVRIGFNTFQRIDDGNLLWKQNQPAGFSDLLTPHEFDRIKLLFQRRHLLSHTEGFVDAKYLQNTNDSSYQVGQRIIINKSDVEECKSLIEKIVVAL